MIDRVGTKVRPAEREVLMANLCPACHVDRDQVKEMLAEPPVAENIQAGGHRYEPPLLKGGVLPHTRTIETENHANARHIIENCHSCEAYFRTYVRKP